MLAKTPKTVYDGKVVRFAFSLLTAILFFAIGLIFSPTALAVCSLSITPQKVPGDYKGQVTIQSDGDCFDENTIYTINAHPLKVDSNPGLYANYLAERIKPIDKRTIATNLDLFNASIGRENPGTWKVLVCTGNLSECKETSLGSVDITIGAVIPTSGAVIPTSSPISPLSPCVQWVYAFPTDSPDYRLNDKVIPTGNPEYINPDFKTRKCIVVQTGIGNISTEPQGFVKSIFSLVLGLAGGIALILIMISGYRMMASQGNPEALTNARGQLISAVVGLLFIIFSFVILQVIGVDILKIPGFTR